MSPYDEAAYQTKIVGRLVTQDYRQLVAVYSRDEGVTDGRALYDAHRALLPDEFVDFVRTSQPETWRALTAVYGPDLPSELERTLASDLDRRGTIDVLRQGLTLGGHRVHVVGFKPTDHGTDAGNLLHRSNRFVVVQELKFNPLQVVDEQGDHRMRLDLVLFLNGIPLITAELKNQLTGQTVADAIDQYQRDRSPAAPIFRYPSRSIVQFVVDKRRAFMTTRLDGVRTQWHPFDRGYQDGKGNPPEPAGGASGVEYLWEEVWAPASVLELIQRFVAWLPPDDLPGSLTPLDRLSKGKVVFPRYHQRRAVRGLVARTLADGVGRHFLVQHSTGSGKSLTIGWLAHELAGLHDAAGCKVYDKVIVISDRGIVVSQLQDLVSSLSVGRASDHVVAIDGPSRHLGEAIDGLVPIIVCTIHRFSYLRDFAPSTAGRNFAVIVDEAHSSQHGELSAELMAFLGDAPGRPRNLTFFAFTATPTDLTSQHFGEAPLPGHHAREPFDVYAMRQAREEGFVVDVLRHYLSYRQLFLLTPLAAAQTQVAGETPDVFALASTDPSAIAKKATVILRHYLAVVHGHLGEQARAMVVANGRDAARHYTLAFRELLAQQGRLDVRVLVGFSGQVTDDEETNTKADESALNSGVGGMEIPARLRRDHHILVVANKFQTGFDEPRLVAMYLDKPVSGLNAVQTLSRLNRAFPGKGEGGFDPIVVDFVNEPDAIFQAFQKYDASYQMRRYLPADLLKDLAASLDASGVYEADWPARVLELRQHPAADSAPLDQIHNDCIRRFEQLPSPEDRRQFRHFLLAFLRLFCSVIQLPDADQTWTAGLLERRALYTVLRAEVEAWTEGPVPPATLSRQHFTVDQFELIEQGRFAPVTSPGGPGSLPTPVAIGTPRERIVLTLEELLRAFHARYGAASTGEATVSEVLDLVAIRGRLVTLAQAATQEDLPAFRHLYRQELRRVLAEGLRDPHLRRVSGLLLNELDGLARSVADEASLISFDEHRKVG